MDSSSSGGRKRLEPDPRVRAAILAAAGRIVLTDGVGALSIAAVLGETQLGTRAFYRHFGSKDELVAALFVDMARTEMERTRIPMEAAADPVRAVAAWIDGSGFTLEELASIQPAYITANADGWKVWDLAAHPPADGAFTYERVAGAFARGAMTGPWTVKNAHDQVVGTGELARGAGTWHSFYADGTTRLADGPFVGNVAHGAWTFYHRNGTVAAEGRFTRGVRTGAWAFYDDAPDHHRIATGAFGPDGRVVGAWSHYDADGTLLARSRHDGARERIDVVPDRDGISRQLYQRADGNPVEWYIHGLERVARGADQLYLETTSASRAQIGFGVAPEPTDPPRVVIYDADGHRLARGPDGWTAADCHWPQIGRAHV